MALFVGESRTCAIDHCLWAAEQGASPRQVLAAVGIRWGRREPRWDDAVTGLAIHWRRHGSGQTAGGDGCDSDCRTGG